MDESPRQEERPGCRDALLVTSAVFTVVLPVVGALIALAGALAVAVVLFAVHPALALLPAGAVVVGIYLFARWERARFRPPGAG